MNKEFNHLQFAHCESGVISTLLSHYGLKLSEPMAFGITSSLSFAYLPIIKLNDLPLIAYRSLPKSIVKNISKVLDIPMEKRTYFNENKAQKDLEELLDEGKLVGLQTSVYYLPYFPRDMRFHFNAHNLMVYGKNKENYFISDPVFEHSIECEKKALLKARFAKGAFAPKGFLYYPKKINKNIDFSKAIKKAILKNTKIMLSPFPYGGVKGMRKLAKKILSLKRDNNDRYLKNFLTHIVRMQEEIGTGGGGFRFLYAAFLKEAKTYDLNNQTLDESSELLIKSGNTLREFALYCVEASKNLDNFDSSKISNKLIQASEYEEKAFIVLKNI